VYAYIFSTIGVSLIQTAFLFLVSLCQVEGLRRDLLVWSSGLFPFFQSAATSVRPILISLYETYYLPLGEDLRPATKALVLALLPGMEEETGDFFDRVSLISISRRSCVDVLDIFPIRQAIGGCLADFLPAKHVLDTHFKPFITSSSAQLFIKIACPST
jgi:hypothetical protein